MTSEAAILLKDTQGEKSHGKVGSIFRSSSKPVCRGELLIFLPRVKVVPRKDGKPAHNFQLANDPSVTLFCSEHDVAPLSDYDYNLMVAIKSRGARFDVFRKDVLDWGSKLKEGEFVFVALPSKTPVSTQRAVSLIRYVGPLPNELGIQFGVEIQEDEHRHEGSSNGFFGGEQFFECEENSALFVSLDRLSPMEPVQQKPPAEVDPTADQLGQDQVITRSRSKALQGDPRQQGLHVDQPSKQLRPHFRINDRVVVYNKQGVPIHGIVRWGEEVNFGGEVVIGVGIETDVSVQSKDFEWGLTGFRQHFKCTDSRHGKIVIPESMVILEAVDAAQRHERKENVSTQGSSVDARAHESAHVQVRNIQQVTEQREDEYLKSALRTSTFNREQQVRLMRDIERAHEEKKLNGSDNQSNVDPNYWQDGHYENIPGVTDPSRSSRPPYQQPPTGSNEPPVGASSEKGHAPAFASGKSRQDLQRMKDHYSIQDDRLLGPHGYGRASNAPLRHQRSMPDEHAGLHQALDYTHQPQGDLSSQPLYDNLPGPGSPSQQGLQPLEGGHPENLLVHEQLYSDNRAAANYQQNLLGHQGRVAESAHNFPDPQLQRMHPLHQHQQGAQQQRLDGGQVYQNQLLQQYGLQPTYAYDGTNLSNTCLPSGVGAIAPQETVSRSFSTGSTVQLQSHPPRYGVIRWIGTLPGVQEGRIAGVELEEPLEGCNDGSWNGVRYFNCHQGYGFFCPLSSLAPDQRFAHPLATDVNPLDGVAMEESRDQVPGQILEYVGEGRGIQGHQNSCYLDSTVFGLFAASDVFDNMFLEQKAHDPAGNEVKYLLWKGIVNPLRKNGVVRHESVMKLRNKLEELGKMKGVNQDEKDPEEFLNMLFKHTLHVPPFINIKRPFGVEQEYFVQLFVERDDSLKLPTVGDLLSRMFKEQKIRFTKVPSKLLIQIPRYGREFKTYQKTIPSIKLELKGLLTSKRRCFVCGESAWKECRECTPFFTKPTAAPHEVVYFCESCAQLSHGKATKRDKHTVLDVATDAGGINELDLLSVICIETSHYICFTRSEDRWVFFDSMANRVNDMYNIPKVVDCTNELNEWVYPADGDHTRLLNTPPRQLPEYVRRFTQDIYLCVYIQPDFAMYGDFEDDPEDDIDSSLV